MIRAESLPKTVDQAVRYLAAEPFDRGPFHGKANQCVISHLKAGWLGYATADMAALAMHSGADLPRLDWTPEARVAPAGLLAFDGGVGDLELSGTEKLDALSAAWGVKSLPVDAVSWGDATLGGDSGCLVTMWLARRRLAGIFANVGWEFNPDLEHQPPPLIPLSHTLLPVHPGDPDEHDDFVDSVLRALNAAWALMQQPQLVEQGAVRVDKKVARALARAGQQPREVKLVDVRRRYRANQQPAGPSGPAPRRQMGNWRWVVRGHWRDQACGVGRQERRRIWVADYWKGDGDAPLLATTKVNVWRR